MKNNPFIKIPEKINKALYSNTSIINYNITNYDWSTGETSTVTINRNIYVSNPYKVSENIVDGINIKSGDVILNTSFIGIKNSNKSKTTDPEILINGIKKTLSELRPFNIMNGGIDTENDRIVFCGITYQIIAISGIDFYANTPTEYKLQLRIGT